MLPAPKTDRISLADVLPSCLSALAGESNRLGLARVTRAVIVVVDGLGAAALRARAGHARTLAAALGPATTIESGFPTTTVSALATLTTGQPPGVHGLVGYTALDTAHDRIVNQLSGWDDRLDPATWQRSPTLFETAPDGVTRTAIGPERYRDSGFSRAVLRDADYVAAKTIENRFTAAAEWMSQPGGPGMLYLYVPELDMAAHASGWESDTWSDRLEAVDSGLRALVASLRPGAGVLLTADHGMVDVAPSAHVLFDRTPGLVDGVRHVAGDPRCLQLHVEPDLGADGTAALVERWRAAEGHRSWVATRSEAIAANWFGAVDPEVEHRIGDILIAARKQIAYYDSRTATDHARAMVGQHGSHSVDEVRVPLLRFGAWAR